MKIELKLTLKLDNGKQVTLNTAEAKELHAQLAEVFAPKAGHMTYPLNFRTSTTSADANPFIITTGTGTE